MPDKKAAQDALLEGVHRRALEIIELPASEREERYAYYRRVCYASAKATGMSEPQAKEAFEKMDEWARAMVSSIDPAAAALAAQHSRDV